MPAIRWETIGGYECDLAAYFDQQKKLSAAVGNAATGLLTKLSEGLRNLNPQTMKPLELASLFGARGGRGDGGLRRPHAAFTLRSTSRVSGERVVSILMVQLVSFSRLRNLRTVSASSQRPSPSFLIENALRSVRVFWLWFPAPGST